MSPARMTGAISGGDASSFWPGFTIGGKMIRTPFKRALALMQKIREIHERLKDKGLLAIDQEIAALPPYRSRGHGGKHRTRNRQIGGRWAQNRSRSYD
jgi:hypothetical protein